MTFLYLYISVISVPSVANVFWVAAMPRCALCGEKGFRLFQFNYNLRFMEDGFVDEAGLSHAEEALFFCFRNIVRVMNCGFNRADAPGILDHGPVQEDLQPFCRQVVPLAKPYRVGSDTGT